MSNTSWCRRYRKKVFTFFYFDENVDLTHPVKNPSSCHVEDLGGGILAVLLGKQGHLQLEGKCEGGYESGNELLLTLKAGG